MGHMGASWLLELDSHPVCHHTLNAFILSIFCTGMGLKMRGLLDLPHFSVVAPALGFQFCNLLSGAWCCTDSLEFGWAGKRDTWSFVFEHLSVWVICADGSVVDGKRVWGAPLGLSYTIISLNFFSLLLYSASGALSLLLWVGEEHVYLQIRILWLLF